METILTAIDFTDTSLNAARYAAQLSNQLKVDKIILYHSYDLLPTTADIPASVTLSDGKMQERSIELLDDLKKELRVLTATDTEILVKANSLKLADGINDLATKYGASLVVIGLTGKKAWEKFIVGSSTKSILKRCQLPLLVIPQDAAFTPIDRMVMGCDLKKVAETMPIEKIKSLIEGLNAQLQIVHVDHQENKHFSADMIRQQYAFYHMFEEVMSTMHYVDNKSVEKGILTYAHQQHAQLILVIAKSHSFMARLTKESVTSKLASKSTLPLLIINESAATG